MIDTIQVEDDSTDACIDLQQLRHGGTPRPLMVARHASPYSLFKAITRTMPIAASGAIKPITVQASNRCPSWL